MVGQQELHHALPDDKRTAGRFIITHYMTVGGISESYLGIEPYLALRVFSELVRMFHPFMTGMAQAATGLGGQDDTRTN